MIWKLIRFYGICDLIICNVKNDLQEEYECITSEVLVFSFGVVLSDHDAGLCLLERL